MYIKVINLKLKLKGDKMLKNLIIWTMLLGVVNINKAQVVKDTIWIEDFEDGNFDVANFPQTGGRIGDSEYPFDGKSLIYDLDNGFCGAYDLPFKLELNTGIVYDSILIKSWPGLNCDQTNEFPTKLSYTTSWPCDFINDPECRMAGPADYTLSINPGECSRIPATEVGCYNCSTLSFDGTLKYHLNVSNSECGFDYATRKIFTRNNQEWWWTEAIGGDSQYYGLKNYSSEWNRLLGDFCERCAADNNGREKDDDVYNDCLNNVVLPSNVTNFVEVDLNVAFVYAIGYRQEVSTGINVLNQPKREVKRYFDLIGRGINNPKGMMVIVEYFNGEREIVQF